MTADPSPPVPDGPPLGLYVHWPFCVTKCPYCDFNSHVRDGWDETVWQRALLADLAHEAAMTPGYRLVSVFFGGGTPSLMAPATVARVLDRAAALWATAPDLEVSLEANPSSVEAARFRDLAAAGVQRLSLGLQALDDVALRLLGRPHDVAQGLRALRAAVAVFPRVSIDLIHSRPDQTAAAWARELDRALAFGTGHLSAYQLTIEPGTRFASLARRGRLALPPEDEAAAMFELTAERCRAAGLGAYEISNHARPGEECRHNLHVWRYGAYVGIGPGAHGRRGGVATVRHRRPEAYLGAVAHHGHGIADERPVPPAQAAREALLMGLRLAEGVDPVRFQAATGVALVQAINPEARVRLQSWGLLAPGPGLVATAAGRAVLDAVLVELVAPLERAAAEAT
ncbi:MAG: radical SAM family heme chaperone HemW [Sphingomonadaceae bacterium]|uniref:radical SAM family heme chaperone HemW n=1 Tax=Thermaurantiacus sp. TaxID=2820283 RepID=UPI00298F1D42|nr:radical SAM family heme chaperone HemW [Thermaurantiacus sp.]MCS6986994.1 radical SAM family heme chaperone HemW [Sphingomonadaceae bacterium]MDW8415668.1 radical SAM family heme chaperone HemW [Thermaurantiacus sp.]